ncbi:type VI secretion system baseplate subunit TssE [Neptunomonas sp.]|uniref:type VI secretion system baseplate subunit TssE n=1 Tax=Neptunomonas sp. TaxID=1971898 RepID=UPI002600B61A|nr:type VI secretion system baseplate subunit TssE [Neptunomonas sp.]
MAELYQQDRLQPSLLDRLTDDNARREPNGEGANEDSLKVKQTAGRTSKKEPVDRLVITARNLREYVKRDLSWLLNSGNLENVVDLSDYPWVAKSVVNYGTPDLAGTVAANTDVRTLERQIHRTILNFEPRILPKTLRVRVIKNDEMSRNALCFEIECDIWGQPVPEHLYLNSEVDLETGLFEFFDRPRG